MKQRKINVKGTEIILLSDNINDFISLSDIARFQDPDRVNYIVQNWMRSRSTIEFLGLWEKLNNPNFKGIEFDAFRANSGLNSFSLTPKRWIESVNAKGITSKSGHNGGTYAHKDIAFEFASWISPEFKLYLIKEFQRLKDDENRRLTTGWDVKRTLAKVNYRIHTDAIKEYIIPKITIEQANFTYANEADVLNKALFGLTAKEWDEANPEKKGNIRDYADVTQLVCLSNLESLNAEFIREGLSQDKRLVRLNETAIFQMKSLIRNPSIKKLNN